MSTPAKGGTRARRAAKGSVAKTPERAEAEPSSAAPEPDRPAPSRDDLDPDVLAALEEQRDFLLRSLEDLEREHAAGDVDDVDYQALKDDYTARAASVITTIERRRQVLAGSTRSRRWGLVAAVVAALALFGLGAGWLVAASSGQRQPGDTISGDVRSSSIDELAKASQYTADATAAQQSGDSGAAVTAYRNALDSYRKVLDAQPDNVEALTYRGWLLHVLALQASDDVARGLDQDALTSLDRAVAVEGAYPDARIFRAIILQRQGRASDAMADLDVVDPSKIPPGMTELVDGLRTQLRADLGQAGG